MAPSPSMEGRSEKGAYALDGVCKWQALTRQDKQLAVGLGLEQLGHRLGRGRASRGLNQVLNSGRGRQDAQGPRSAKTHSPSAFVDRESPATVTTQKNAEQDRIYGCRHADFSDCALFRKRRDLGFGHPQQFAVDVRVVLAESRRTAIEASREE